MSVIVYTSILGHSDSIKKAPSGASQCVCFVDDPASYAGQTRGWELRRYGTTQPRRAAWHLRCVPHLLFPNAQKTIWIDASFTITDLDRLLLDSGGHDLSTLPHPKRKSCYAEGAEIIKIGQADAVDVNRQLDGYRAEGFEPATLSITCILVRANTPLVSKFNETWEEQILQHRGDNTQISLDYAAWKTGLQVHRLQGQYRDNPYAHYNHKDHKELRRPYDTDTTVRRS